VRSYIEPKSAIYGIGTGDPAVWGAQKSEVSWRNGPRAGDRSARSAPVL
jgi:hypothetical protein